MSLDSLLPTAKKIVDPTELPRLVAQLRKEDMTIATLNGSFDLLHAGHLYIISEAAKQADLLIVALNSDSSVKSYKGENKPYVALENRLHLIAALQWVDFVTWFDESTPCSILEKIAPDVHVNGAEYGTECIEAPTLKKIGARLHLVDRIPALSTSELVKKICSSEKVSRLT